VMILLSWGSSFGPKMFTGGMANVTRQYDERRRSSRISWTGRSMMCSFASRYRHANSMGVASSQIDWHFQRTPALRAGKLGIARIASSLMQRQ
jgi:hypothetical protein